MRRLERHQPGAKTTRVLLVLLAFVFGTLGSSQTGVSQDNLRLEESDPSQLDRLELHLQSAEVDSLQEPGDGCSVTHDNGITIRPENLEQSPFSLKVNHQNTFRYTGFARDETSWIDSTGATNPIFNRTDFAIPRGRLILSGNALMPDLTYLLNIDYNTVNNNPIGFRAYALSYRFSPGFQVHAGQNKVPGTREWIHSSFDAQHGPDRSMATTFFSTKLKSRYLVYRSAFGWCELPHDDIQWVQHVKCQSKSTQQSVLFFEFGMVRALGRFRSRVFRHRRSCGTRHTIRGQLYLYDGERKPSKRLS